MRDAQGAGASKARVGWLALTQYLSDLPGREEQYTTILCQCLYALCPVRRLRVALPCGTISARFQHGSCECHRRHPPHAVLSPTRTMRSPRRPVSTRTQPGPETCAEPTEGRRPAMSLVHPGTILVVDDDGGHAILITKALRRAHITNPITTLHDGQDAVNLCCATGQSTGGDLPLPLLMDPCSTAARSHRAPGAPTDARRGTDPVAPCHPRQRRGCPGRPRPMPCPRVCSLSHQARAGGAVARHNTTAGTRAVCIPVYGFVPIRLSRSLTVVCEYHTSE